MKIVFPLILFGTTKAMAMFPFIIVKDARYKKAAIMMNHEKIHIRQQLEMLVLPFYLCYIAEWLIRLFMKGNAYRNISFEREAYANQYNLTYLETRKWYSFINYLILK